MNTKYTLLLLIPLAIFSCQNSGTKEPEDEEYANEDAMSGTFANGQDSLTLERQTNVMNQNEIDFNLTAFREESQEVVFNVATSIEVTEDMEQFKIKEEIYGDSGAAKGYYTLNFIYNYKKDNWQVIDSTVITDSTFNYTGHNIDKSGLFERVQ